MAAPLAQMERNMEALIKDFAENPVGWDVKVKVTKAGYSVAFHWLDMDLGKHPRMVAWDFSDELSMGELTVAAGHYLKAVAGVNP